MCACVAGTALPPDKKWSACSTILIGHLQYWRLKKESTNARLVEPFPPLPSPPPPPPPPHKLNTDFHQRVVKIQRSPIFKSSRVNIGILVYSKV